MSCQHNIILQYAQNFLTFIHGRKNKLMKFSSLNTKLLYVTIFAMAMAFLETAVVIYLRKIYYPEGFFFPLQPISKDIIITELFRELATMLMLLSIGWIASKKALDRFAWFILAFGVWDIFYYIFLKLFIGWPESLLTWDVLFLLPSTWVGPVIGPVINSVTMILLALLILYHSHQGLRARIIKREWWMLISGSVIVIISYTEEYLRYMLREFHFGEIITYADNASVMAYASGFIPLHFNWLIYLAGQMLFFLAILSYARRVFGRSP